MGEGVGSSPVGATGVGDGIFAGVASSVAIAFMRISSANSSSEISKLADASSSLVAFWRVLNRLPEFYNEIQIKYNVTYVEHDRCLPLDLLLREIVADR